jgi:hypothetical protein
MLKITGDFAKNGVCPVGFLRRAQGIDKQMFSPQIVQSILSKIRMFCVNEPIDMALEMFRPAAEVKKAQDYLNSR